MNLISLRHGCFSSSIFIGRLVTKRAVTGQVISWSIADETDVPQVPRDPSLLGHWDKCKMGSHFAQFDTLAFFVTGYWIISFGCTARLVSIVSGIAILVLKLLTKYKL